MTHSNTSIELLDKNTNKIYDLNPSQLEFLRLKVKGTSLSKSHSNINTQFQGMDTNRNFLIERLLEFQNSRAEGMYQYRNHSNRGVELADKDTNKICGLRLSQFESLIAKEKGKYLDKSHSSRDIEIQSMCTNRNFLIERLPGFGDSKEMGKC